MSTIKPLELTLLAEQIAACLALADRLELGHVAAHLEQARTLTVTEASPIAYAA